VQLTAEMLEKLAAEDCLEGTKVELTAGMVEQLAAADCLTGTEVELTPTIAEKLTSAGFLDSTDILLKAKLEGYEDVDGLLTALQNKVSEVSTALAAEQGNLSAMETELSSLEEKLGSTKKKKEKSALQEQIEELSEAIVEQREKVANLDATYASLDQEYVTAKASADELTAKQERLAEVKQLLIGYSGGLITATDAETEAFAAQVAALEGLADSRIADFRREAYENIQAQSKGYVDAVKTEIQSSEALIAAQERQSEAMASVAVGASGMQDTLFGIFDDLVAKVDEVNEQGLYFLDTEKGRQYWDEQLESASKLILLLTGEEHSFDGAGLAGLSYVLDNMVASASYLEEAWGSANDSVSQYETSITEAQGTQAAFLNNLVDGVLLGGMSLETLESLLTEAFAKHENSAELVASAMAHVEEKTREAEAAVESFADGQEYASQQSASLQFVLADYAEQMAELGKAYDDAYNSAYKSMDGQFKLFEKVSKGSSVSVTDMIKNLDAQAQYMEAYAANLEKAKAMGVSDELLSALSDGSADSAAALQNIVSSSETKIGELNASFAKVQDGKDTFAGTVAEMETDFAASMLALETNLTTTIENMDLNAEAAESGKNTIQGFIDGAEDMTAAVTLAYGNIAQAAINALNAKLKIKSPSEVFDDSGVYSMQGYIGAVERMEPDIEAVMSDAAQAGINAFNSREAALHVATNDFESLSISASVGPAGEGGTIEIHIEPIYNFNGSSDTNEIRSMLHDQNEDLRNLILEVVEEANIDAGRMVYR